MREDLPTPISGSTRESTVKSVGFCDVEFMLFGTNWERPGLHGLDMLQSTSKPIIGSVKGSNEMLDRGYLCFRTSVDELEGLLPEKHEDSQLTEALLGRPRSSRALSSRTSANDDVNSIDSVEIALPEGSVSSARREVSRIGSTPGVSAGNALIAKLGGSALSPIDVWLERQRAAVGKSQKLARDEAKSERLREKNKELQELRRKITKQREGRGKKLAQTKKEKEKKLKQVREGVFDVVSGNTYLGPGMPMCGKSGMVKSRWTKSLACPYSLPENSPYESYGLESGDRLPAVSRSRATSSKHVPSKARKAKRGTAPLPPLAKNSSADLPVASSRVRGNVLGGHETSSRSIPTASVVDLNAPPGRGLPPGSAMTRSMSTLGASSGQGGFSEINSSAGGRCSASDSRGDRLTSSLFQRRSPHTFTSRSNSNLSEAFLSGSNSRSNAPEPKQLTMCTEDKNRAIASLVMSGALGF